MKARQHINIRILPRDAYMLVALLQFADRNPNLTEEHHELLYTFGSQLALSIVELEPIVGKYLAMGWDPQYDTPIEKPQEE